MTNLRHVASSLFVVVAFGCATDRKSTEPPMEPASYEAPPDTTAEPKGLPPNAPPAPGEGSTGMPEDAANGSPGMLQKEGPKALPPGTGGKGGGGMGGVGGTLPVGGKSPIGGPAR